jgi:DNA-directed RNA polymerase specialized sigma24 family protein
MTLLERPAPDSSRETAVRLLGDYGRERGRGQALRAQLGERFPECQEETIEDAVQSACRSFLDEAEGISDPAKAYLWIRTAAYRAVLRELRQRRRAIPLVPTEGVIGEAVEEGPGPVEELIELEDKADLEVLVEEVAASLSEERRAVLALWPAGRRRSEIAAELGLGDRSVKRALERPRRGEIGISWEADLQQSSAAKNSSPNSGVAEILPVRHSAPRDNWSSSGRRRGIPVDGDRRAGEHPCEWAVGRWDRRTQTCRGSIDRTGARLTQFRATAPPGPSSG